MVSPICKNRPTPSEGDFGILEPAAGSPRRRFGCGIENAEIVFLGGWYKLETP